MESINSIFMGRKGHKWTISDNCEFLMEEGAFRRRPRGYKARKRPGFGTMVGVWGVMVPSVIG